MEKSLLKVSSFTLLLAGWLCASCQDDQIVDQKVSLDNSNTIQLVEITDNNEVVPVTSTRNSVSSASNLALKFASEADYLAALRDIEERDLAGKLHFADSLGLTSMQKLLQLADDELESIGANALNEVILGINIMCIKKNIQSILSLIKLINQIYLLICRMVMKERLFL